MYIYIIEVSEDCANELRIPKSPQQPTSKETEFLNLTHWLSSLEKNNRKVKNQFWAMNQFWANFF
jgi:hypothetical protein